MTYLLTAIHILVCLFLVIVVLLQSGKAADLAGAFGGMGSQTAFGPRGSATVLSKATTIAAALFMITSLSLAIIATNTGAGGGSTVLEAETPATETPAPGATPPADPSAQPSVTLTPEGGGESVTIPIDIPPAPSGEQQQQQAPPDN